MQSLGEKSLLRSEKMDPVYDSETVQEEAPPRIPKKISVGRVINLCIAFDFLLIVVTALTAVGSLGTLNVTVLMMSTIVYILLKNTLC